MNMPSIIQNQRLLLLCVIIAAVFIAIVAFIFSVTGSDDEGSATGNFVSNIEENGADIDPSLYDTPFKDLGEPQIERVVEWRDPPKPPVEKVDLSDVFKVKKKVPTLSEAEKKRLAIIRSGIESGTVKTIFAAKDFVEKKDLTRSWSEDQNVDKDFTNQGFQKSIPTYPVNLDRTITSTKFIPIVLYTALNSELPSKKVIAKVEQDIYGDHGRKILIPKGSTAEGSYESLNDVGDTRLQISWNRILTPEGINIVVRSETVNEVGGAGVSGEIDNRMEDRYGAALLFSSVSALAQLSVPSGD
jgi:type IV secretory pathway VirB10-like protein